MKPDTKSRPFQRAYAAGLAAFQAGEPVSSCPYKIAPTGSHRRNSGTWGAVYRNYWQRGWYDGKERP